MDKVDGLISTAVQVAKEDFLMKSASFGGRLEPRCLPSIQTLSALFK